jgi:hypothetical protein
MYEMHCLKANVSKHQNNLKAETYVIYHKGRPGDSVLQVDLFYTSGKWYAWTGCITRSDKVRLAHMCAETRNALA